MCDAVTLGSSGEFVGGFLVGVMELFGANGVRVPRKMGGSPGFGDPIAIRDGRSLQVITPEGGAAIGCRFRGSLRRHGVFGIRFFSLRCRFVFFTFVAAQRACFFRENDPYPFVGRPRGPGELAPRVRVLS